MVKVTLTGKCKGCPNFHAETHKLYSFNEPMEVIIKCEHEDFCNRLEQYLKETLSNE